MYQKNSNNKGWFYLVVIVILGILLWLFSREMPIEQERIEQKIENTFANR